MHGRLSLTSLCGALLLESGWCWGGALVRAGPTRHQPPRLQFGGAASDEIDGWGGTTDGGTMFAAWDGRDGEGVSPEGAIPPGDDLIERDLRRVFDLESEDSMLGGSDADEIKVRLHTALPYATARTPN